MVKRMIKEFQEVRLSLVNLLFLHIFLYNFQQGCYQKLCFHLLFPNIFLKNFFIYIGFFSKYVLTHLSFIS